jgi:hypothetical protein
MRRVLSFPVLGTHTPAEAVTVNLGNRHRHFYRLVQRRGFAASEKGKMVRRAASRQTSGK